MISPGASFQEAFGVGPRLGRRPLRPGGLLGQALEKIFREEICTPREADCGHQVLLPRLLCLSLEGTNRIQRFLLRGAQPSSRQTGHRSADPVQTFIQFPVINGSLRGRDDLRKLRRGWRRRLNDLGFGGRHSRWGSLGRRRRREVRIVQARGNIHQNDQFEFGGRHLGSWRQVELRALGSRPRGNRWREKGSRGLVPAASRQQHQPGG